MDEATLATSMERLRQSVNKLYDKMEAVEGNQRGLASQLAGQREELNAKIGVLFEILRGSGRDTGLVGVTDIAMRKIEELEEKTEKLEGQIGRLKTGVIVLFGIIIVMLVIGGIYLAFFT